jgi:hypothetical protein
MELTSQPTQANHLRSFRTGTNELSGVTRNPWGYPASEGAGRSALRPHTQRTERKSAASCSLTTARLAEGHQPPPLPLLLLLELEGAGFELDLRALPDGVAAHQRPPEALRSLPLNWPAAVSPVYVYSGWPS